MKKIYYVIIAIGIINVLLLIAVFSPQLAKIKQQIKQDEVVPAGIFIPTFHDYYYDYVLTDSTTEGEWRIDTYEEVKRLVDENGHKITDIPTGRYEYMRYFTGDDADAIIFEIMDEEGEPHDHEEGDDHDNVEVDDHS